MVEHQITQIESSLICPACSHGLITAQKGYVCKKCNREYGKTHGIPVLVAEKSMHKAEEASYHSSISSSYGGMHQLMSYRNHFFHLRALLPLLSRPPHSSVLELGCGIGFDAIPLLEHRLLVVETDIASGQVIEAQHQIRKRGLSARALFYIADAENIPFSSETFDAVLIVAALHHLEHPAGALQQMKRCLRRGGSVVIAMEPNTWEWVKVFSIPFAIAKFLAFKTVGRKRLREPLQRAEAFREPTIERTFSKRELIDLVLGEGFIIKSIEPVWFLCGFLQWFNTLLDKISTRKWHINADIERFCVHLDRIIGVFPFIDSFCCNWTLHCIKE